MYVVGPDQIPLCLEHGMLHQQMIERQLAELQRGADQALDDMEMITGVPMRPRRPQPPPVTVVRPSFHSINIKDSTVGVVNQGGNLKIVDAAVTAIGRAGDQGLANALKTLTEVAMGHQGIESAQKQEAAQILSVLASEATVPQDQRRAGAARPLLHRLKEILAVSAEVATIAAPALDVVRGAFGI
jgi:hypothetical protein